MCMKILIKIILTLFAIYLAFILFVMIYSFIKMDASIVMPD